MLAEYLKAVPRETVTNLAQDKYQVRDPNNGVIGLQVFNRFVYGTINCIDSMTQDRYLNEVTANLLK
jgi:hypothetical protein